ncbi:MAG: SPOR domain-containing protein [Sphingomonadales bacterium]
MATDKRRAWRGMGCRSGVARMAARLLATAAIAGAVVAVPARADFQAGMEAYSRGDYKTAMSEWQPYAEAGDQRALFNLGQMHRLGVGTEKDLDKAEQYYRRAAELGHVGAQANLGSLLFDRKPPQGAEAVKFWRQAAVGGDPKAQFMLGVQYFNGDFVTRDAVQAHAWLSLAAKAGVREAADALAAVKLHMEPAAVEAAAALAPTLVAPPAEQAEPPAMQAKLADDIEAQIDSAVLRHPVEDFAASGVSPINPESVAGAIPIPPMEMIGRPASPQPVPPPPPPAAPAKPAPQPKPSPPAETRDTEYRVQLASFATKDEAEALRRSVLDSHGALFRGAGVDVEQMLSIEPGAVAYRVRSTPLKGGQSAADAICSKLETSGIPCQPAKTVKIPVSIKTDAEPAKPAEPPAPPSAVSAPPPPVEAAEAAVPAAPADDAEEPGPHSAHPGDKWRVQVGAGKTEEEARFRWSRLMGANADLLDAAELYIYKADLGAKGVFYRVQIGGFAARPDAIGLCERLKSRKVDCFVTATEP